MAARADCSVFSPAIISPSNPALKHHQTVNSLLCPNFYKPISSSPNSKKPTHSLHRLRICQAKAVSYRLFVVGGLVDGDAETYPVADSSDSNPAISIDIKLPRRSLLVEFTCDCGERTNRLINRLAYERGLVYVQCAGCERYHKLADNLGLVVEYDLREEKDIGAESNMDQV